ncbi:MAG: ABC transporter permease [Rhodospirillaceae bacterium]|nr:ABC transporter permease [Rhodospirillaceae bacterium]
MSGGNWSVSPGRIGAIVLRHYYLMRSSWVRLLELAYWPVLNMTLWGFITLFLMGQSSLIAQAVGLLLGAVLLWDVLLRSQLGLGLAFLEEMWSRNLGHLMVSPLRPHEFVAALFVVALFRVLVGVGPAALLAWLLYDYSIFSMGLPLIAFFVNLVVLGWSIGLAINGLILRYGLGAENMAWMALFVIAPISGIYYPLSVLPPWLRPVAEALPAAHVFEGMRAVLIQHTFRVDLFFNAALLNVVYFAAGAGAFLLSYRAARRRGLILQIGE